MVRSVRAAILALFAGLIAQPASAATPVVVELFTSQGCSSCPPADALLARLSRQPGVLALSFGVTYWDRLGWKDTFARPEYTRRQRDYAAALGKRNVYTPQVVVQGREETIGSRRAEVESLIAAARKQAGGPAISLEDGQVTIGPGKPARPADVWLVRYDPRELRVPVGRGENGGRTLPHRNVVRSLVRLGSWTGATASLPLPAAAPDLASAVLVQLPGGGPILAAATP
ncbi:MAG: DUF1223 domain-containing protein [Sphingomonadales bacterium]